MTDMKPSQAAREAAARYFAEKLGGGLGEHLAVLCDDNSIVQAFAKFEAETRKDEREKNAPLMQSLTALLRWNGEHEHMPDHNPIPDDIRMAIATAILSQEPACSSPS